MEKKRALRRAHTARLKRRARTVYPDTVQPERLANNLKNRSCFMCGNPRRWFGHPSFGERKAELCFRLFLNDSE